MRKDTTPALAEFLYSIASAFTQLGEAVEAGDVSLGAMAAALPADPEPEPEEKPKSTRSRKAKADPEPEPEEKPKSTRSRKAKDPEPEPEPEQDEGDGEDPITLEDLQELTSKLLEAGKRKVLKDILAKYDAKSITSAEEDDYDDIYDDLYDAVEELED